MAGINFQKQTAGMKKLRDMLAKAKRFSAAEVGQYILGGGTISVSGVERNLDTSIAWLDRMIQDAEGRKIAKD